MGFGVHPNGHSWLPRGLKGSRVGLPSQHSVQEPVDKGLHFTGPRGSPRGGESSLMPGNFRGAERGSFRTSPCSSHSETILRTTRVRAQAVWRANNNVNTSPPPRVLIYQTENFLPGFNTPCIRHKAWHIVGSQNTLPLLGSVYRRKYFYCTPNPRALGRPSFCKTVGFVPVYLRMLFH